MSPEQSIYYAVQEMVWAGKKATEIRDAVLEAYKEVMRQELEAGITVLKGIR